MKHLFFVSTIVVTLYMLGCSDLYINPNDLDEVASSIKQQPTVKRPDLSNQQKIDNQLVVRYLPGLSDAAKDGIRTTYFVKETKTCACADETLELWTIDLEDFGGGLEEIKGHVSSNPDLEGSDYQYTFQQVTNSVNLVSSQYNSMLNLVKTNNQGVTIAIIDSGLDFDHIGFSTPFLYNSQLSGDFCEQDDQQEISGWDFVSKDNIPEDLNGHGTMIADIIEQTLSETDIAYQILPVKSFDQKGLGTYFDIVCGFQFASTKPDVDIINMSFGWYFEGFEILPELIAEVEGSVLIVGSSGNQGVNVDDFPHFPSGYPYSNVLSIGGIDSSELCLATYSNYGMSSVDIAAASQNLAFVTALETSYISGTSFANANATAAAALLYVPSGTPSELIQTLATSANYKIELEGLIQYPKIIIP